MDGDWPQLRDPECSMSRMDKALYSRECTQKNRGGEDLMQCVVLLMSM